MHALVDLAAPDTPLARTLADGLDRVSRRISEQLASAVDPVDRHCRHVERYRGKMLRPTMVLLSGLAADPLRAAESGAAALVPPVVSDDHIAVGAVVETIHLATLVHDDVLDEADMRRNARTINAMSGNETAVILGDYLIARAFHLCSQLDDQRTALRIGEVTSQVCEGELLQLSRRCDLSLDVDTYFGIVQRKTAALIGVSCEQGAVLAGADAGLARRLYDFGVKVGTAFQIQDDLLDLVGDEATVGKPLGKDLEKGKMTLPLIHFLSEGGPAARAEVEAVVRSARVDPGRRAAMRRRLAESGSIDHARAAAAELVAHAKGLLVPLPPSEARDCLLAMADAVIRRDH